MCTTFRARSASASSITHEILISLAPINQSAKDFSIERGPKHGRSCFVAHTLRDHFDVDILLAQSPEKAAADTDHAPEMAADETHDRHVRHEIHIAPGRQVLDGAAQRLVLDLHLFAAGRAVRVDCDFGVQSHGDVDFGTRNQVYAQTVLVQDAEDRHQEAVGAGALARVDVEDRDAALDGDGSGSLWRLGDGAVAGRSVQNAVRTVVGHGALACALGWVGPDDCAAVSGILDVLDADRNRSTDGLVHGEGMDDFGAVKGQLGGLGRRDGVEEVCCGHLAWIGGEDTIDLFPDL